jgi:hypothetical protein
LATHRLVVWICLLTLFTFSWSIGTQIYFKSSTEFFLSKCEPIEFGIQEEDWETLNPLIQTLHQEFEQVKHTWLILHEHIYIDAIALAIIKLKSSIHNQDKQNAHLEIKSLLFHIQNVYESGKLSIKNIL